LAKHRPTNRTFDLRGHYGGRVPQHAKIAAIDLDDPYGVPVDAESTLVPGPAGATTRDGPKAWQAPPAPRIRVIASVRDDVAAKMFARRQIDRACFMAARGYQTLYEIAESARIRSCDPSMTPVSGGRSDGSDWIDAKAKAVLDLKRVEKRIAEQYGAEAVNLLRDVLGAGKTIQSAARERGEVSNDCMKWIGGFFRRCLRHLAVILGFATRHAYRRA
jgi:hypothetical protein